MPPGRQPIQTLVMAASRLDEVVDALARREGVPLWRFLGHGDAAGRAARPDALETDTDAVPEAAAIDWLVGDTVYAHAAV